jgi:predicted RNA polymerase sigma factor
MGESAATHAAIEAIARNSYGRLVAYLAARSGDVAGAEDALSDALSAALRHWPVAGVPEKPEAWLLHSARNRLIDAARHAQIQKKYEPLLQLAGEAETIATMHPGFPDERLKLLFVCAHPAIDVAVRTPLMLQTVLGLDAERIASAFLASPSAMEQRLVRAKIKIREAGIPFRVPDPPEWGERVSFVLDAIYSAYTAGWGNLIDEGSTHHALAREAVALGRTLVLLMPDDPEAHGLLALMLHCEARRAARIAPGGKFIPLDQHDTTLWSRPLIDEAESHVRTAAAFKRMGRYQLEAAIQSIHAHRVVSGVIDWREIALLYEGLVRLTPTIGAQVGRAIALAESGDPGAGLIALEAIPADRTTNYQPWWAARAYLLRLLGRRAETFEAYHRAASLTDDSALRVYLLDQAAQ